MQSERDTERGKDLERDHREESRQRTRGPVFSLRDGKEEAAELVPGKTFRAKRYREHVDIWKVGP